MFDFTRNWPIYMLLGLTVFFFFYLAHKARQEEKRVKKNRKSKEDSR